MKKLLTMLICVMGGSLFAETTVTITEPQTETIKSVNGQTTLYSGGTAIGSTPSFEPSHGGTLNLVGGTYTFSGIDVSGTQTTLNIGGTEETPVAITQLPQFRLGMATVTINEYANIETSRLVISDGYSGRTTTLTQNGGLLKVTGDNSATSQYASALLGHWQGTSTYTLAGGRFEVPNAAIVMGNAGGTHAFDVAGGTAVAQGFILSGNATGSNTLKIRNGGVFEVGSWGIRVNSNRVLNFSIDNGILRALASSTSNAPLCVGVGGATVDTATHDVTFSGSVLGTGAITKLGTGTLTLNQPSTFSGTIALNAGELDAIVLNAFGESARVSSVATNTTLRVSAPTMLLSTATWAEGGSFNLTLSLKGTDLAHATPIAVPLASGVTFAEGQMTLTVLNGNTGEVLPPASYTKTITDGTITITPVVDTTTILTYTPQTDIDTFTWGIGSLFDNSAVYANLKKVIFNSATATPVAVTVDTGIATQTLTLGAGYTFTGAAFSTGTLTMTADAPGQSTTIEQAIETSSITVANGRLNLGAVQTPNVTLGEGSTFKADTLRAAPPSLFKAIRFIPLKRIATGDSNGSVGEILLYRKGAPIAWGNGVIATETQHYDEADGTCLINGVYTSSGTTDKWFFDASNLPSRSVYVTITFPEPIEMFDAYAVASSDVAKNDDRYNRGITDWALEVSEDGQTFREIDTRTDVPMFNSSWLGISGQTATVNEPYPAFAITRPESDTSITLANNVSLVATGEYNVAITGNGSPLKIIGEAGKTLAFSTGSTITNVSSYDFHFGDDYLNGGVPYDLIQWGNLAELKAIQVKATIVTQPVALGKGVFVVDPMRNVLTVIWPEITSQPPTIHPDDPNTLIFKGRYRGAKQGVSYGIAYTTNTPVGEPEAFATQVDIGPVPVDIDDLQYAYTFTEDLLVSYAWYYTTALDPGNKIYSTIYTHTPHATLIQDLVLYLSGDGSTDNRVVGFPNPTTGGTDARYTFAPDGRGQAFDLNGDWWINAGQPESVKTGSFTLGLWFCKRALRTGQNANEHCFFGTQNWQNGGNLGFSVHEKGLATGGLGGRIDIKPYYTNTIGLWQYLTIVVNRNDADKITMKLYKDGAQFGNTLTLKDPTTADVYIANNMNLLFGHSGTDNYPANSYQDEIALWNSALTTMEVQALYTTYKGVLIEPKALTLKDGLVLYLDGASLNNQVTLSGGEVITPTVGGTKPVDAHIDVVGRGKVFNLIGDWWINAGQPECVNKGSFTLGLWFNKQPNNTSSGNYCFFGTQNWYSGANPGFSVHDMYNGANLTSAWGSSDTSRRNFVFQGETVNQWQYLTLVVDREKNTITCYKDGAFVTTQRLKNTAPTSTDAYIATGMNLLFGRSGHNNYPSKSYQDEISLWNRALSAEEIQTLYTLHGGMPMAIILMDANGIPIADGPAKLYIIAMVKKHTRPPPSEMPITQVLISSSDVNEAYLLNVIPSFTQGSESSILVATLDCSFRVTDLQIVGSGANAKITATATIDVTTGTKNLGVDGVHVPNGTLELLSGTTLDKIETPVLNPTITPSTLTVEGTSVEGNPFYKMIVVEVE